MYQKTTLPESTTTLPLNNFLIYGVEFFLAAALRAAALRAAPPPGSTPRGTIQNSTPQGHYSPTRVYLKVCTLRVREKGKKKKLLYFGKLHRIEEMKKALRPENMRKH